MSAAILDIDDYAAVGSSRTQHLGNNAGIMRLENAAARRDLADAEATIVTNLLGPIRLTNALVDHLSRSRTPRS